MDSPSPASTAASSRPSTKASSAALFVLFGILYDRFNTSQISTYGGLVQRTPMLATLFVISSLAMIGLPLFNSFIGEFLVLSSTFTGVSRSWAAAATIGVILSAAYMLTLVQKIFYGPPSGAVTSNPMPNQLLDLNMREKLVLYSLAALMFVMGVTPNLWLSAIQLGVQPAAAGTANIWQPKINFDTSHLLTIKLKSLPPSNGGQQ
jgi:NADH-quinone oxidoreductase subunit M